MTHAKLYGATRQRYPAVAASHGNESGLELDAPGNGLLIVHPHLFPGGAEWQTVLLANELVARGRRVDVALLFDTGDLVAHLDPRVHWQALNASRRNPLRAAMGLARLISFTKPVTIISRLWSAIFITAVARTYSRRWRWIVFEDQDPNSYPKTVALGGLKLLAVSHGYRSADIVVASTPEVAESAVRVYRLPRLPTVVPIMLRPVDGGHENDPPTAPPTSDGDLRIVTIGGLKSSKGIDLALDALAHAPFMWRWVVVGTGPLAGKLNLTSDDRIQLLGYVADVGTVLRNSHVALQPARHESFGLAVLEALSSHVPVVSGDTPGPRFVKATLPEGARDCLRLVELTPNAIATALDSLRLAYPTDISRGLAAAAVSSAFAVPAIADEWESLLWP